MSSTFRHNKKRNTGLVYEQLVRRMALSMVDRDPENYLKALSIVKKYYSPGQPLAKEREIFEVISKSHGLSEQVARKVLSEIVKYASSIDEAKIDIKKSNLIKDIHHTFGQDFFNVHRVSEYRLLASVQLLIEQSRNKKQNISEGVQKIQLEESLIKYMTVPLQENSSKNRGEKVDGLVAALAMKKFEQRYSGSLNESQKKTIRRFMNYSMTGNKDQFKREMEEERKGLLEKLEASRGMKCFKDDNVMGQRLNEALDSLRALSDVSSEKAVQELLLFHKLTAEIDSEE